MAAKKKATKKKVAKKKVAKKATKKKVAKKKDEQAFDDILQRITITVGVMRSFLNKPKRRM